MNEWPLISKYVTTRLSPVGLDEVMAMDGIERTFWVIFAADYEITNGGFVQLYTNGTGSIPNELPAHLLKLGLEELAVAVDRANSLFPDGMARDDASRENQVKNAGLEESDEGEGPFDDSFKVWIDRNDEIYHRLERLLAENPQLFGKP